MRNWIPACAGMTAIMLQKIGELLAVRFLETKKMREKQSKNKPATEVLGSGNVVVSSSFLLHVATFQCLNGILLTKHR